MFLVVLLPIEQAYAADPVSSSGEQIIDRTRNIPNDLVRQGEAIRDEVLDDLQGIQDSPEDIIGEDIIVQVDDYQPRIIRSSLLEDSGIFVHALISGTPTNPTITVPRIRDIVIRSQKITTIPQGLPVSVGRITHVDPPNNALSYDNLGTLVIPIRQIPQEGKVPDEIIVDVDARIFFDVSEGLFFGPVQDILTEQSLEEWKLTREDHSFYAGYIHATEIKEDQASFMIYDNQLNELTTTPVKLTVGQTSRSLSANRGGFVTYGRLFDRYTLKLNNIKSISDKVRLLINRNGNVQSAYLTEGDDLYQGSQWYVENIAGDVKGVSLAVTLRNKVNRQSLTLEGKQVELPQLPSEPSEPLSSSSSQPGESNEQKKKRTQFEEILKKFYAIYNKKDENVNDVKKYDDLAREIDKDILQDTNTPAQVKEQALNVVKTIRNYYVQKQTELQAALNLNHTQESENKLLIVTGFIKTIEEILKKYTQTREPSSLQGSNDPSVLYRLAIEEYEKVIQNYPNIKEYSAKAHWKIANLALLPGVKDRQGAVNHLEILLRNYQEKDYINYMKKTEIEKLLALIRSADVDLESITKEITEGQDVNYVTLLGAVSVPDNLKSKATIEVEGFPSKEYREGEQLLQDDKDELKWFVKEIRNTEVVLQEERTRQIESIYRDSQNKNQQRQLSTGTNKKRTVRLTKTDTKKEASITISPNTEAAFSEAIFSLHLPIEKRALDLPLFSDTIDEEIAKTEDLIAKLDKIVENVGKVTEYWKKFCFITFAVVWVKNFFSGIFGGSGALARERTNNAFEKKYDEYRNLGTDDTKNCRGLSYDECVFKNQAEYDRMVTQSGSAISAVNQGSYQQSFKTLGSEYTNSKKDLAYYENLAKQDPTNQAYRDKYYEIHARLTRAEEEQQFSKQFFVDGRPKSYDEVGAATADPIVDRYQPEIVQKFTVPPGRKNDKAFLWRTYNTRFLPLEREKQINDEMKKYLDGVQSSGTSLGTATEKDNDYLEKLKESYGVTQATQLGEFKHNPVVSVMDQGRQKGYAEFISIDAFHYVQVTYTTGGRPSKYDLYKRSQPNSRMGGQSDVYMGVVDGQLMDRYQKIKREGPESPDAGLYDAIRKGQDCIGSINKKNAGGKYSRGEVVPLQSTDCSGLGTYTIETAASSIGPSCTEFMSPSDCKLLFNACDPVICPPSRCNLGGEWPVDNVIQTGIIGSAVLCLHNNILSKSLNEGGVVMPVCLSGIYAGLQNIRSVIEGYRQCLITAKVSGRSVGVCDRLRSFGICEILWKEGLALFNAKKGIFRNVINFFLGKSGSGGGEYSAFEQAVDNSVGSLQFFTQSYAKNTFAMYDGAALPELGSEICKAAIFGKAPGLGNLFNQISRPESPPQFTAFFDEAPYSDLGNQPLSQYKVTYHIYAGDNEDIMYTVYMQAADPYTGQFVVQPHVLKDSQGITRNRRLPRGTFASESPDIIFPSGMKEICVEINSRVYGRKVECGFGKVSTSFAINYVSDQFTQNEAKKQITSAAQCVPTSPPTIAELGVVEGAAGTVSSGFIQSGIIRKCSKYNPGVGGDEEKWSPVGTCGEDDRERDLGTCWVYIPAAQNAIKQTSARLDLNTSLAKTAEEVIKIAEQEGEPIPGYIQFNKTTIEDKEREAEQALKLAIPNFEIARSRYQEILSSVLIEEEVGARIQFKMAQSYELEAQSIIRKKQTTTQPSLNPTPQTPTLTPSTSSPVINTINKQQIQVGKEELVTITGKGLANVLVDFDGVMITPDITTDTQVKFKVPSTTLLGKYSVTLINLQGTRSNSRDIEVVTTMKCKVQGLFAPQQYWGDVNGNQLRVLQKNENDMVTIQLKAEGCYKEDLIVKVFEDDLIIDDLIAIIPKRDIMLEDGHLQIPWKVIYESDKILGIPLDTTTIIIAIYHKSDPNKAIFVGKQQLRVTENEQEKTTTVNKKKWIWRYNNKNYELEINIPEGMYESYVAKPHPWKYEKGQEDKNLFKDHSYYILDKDDDILINEIATKLANLAKNNGLTSDMDKIYFATSFVRLGSEGIIDETTKKCTEYPRYPIELLVDNQGDCEDSAILTGAILTALYNKKEISKKIVLWSLHPKTPEGSGHIALGIECTNPPQSAVKFGNYCYFESTLFDPLCRSDIITGKNTLSCVNSIGEMDEEVKKQVDLSTTKIYSIVPKAILSTHQVSNNPEVININGKWALDYKINVVNYGPLPATNVKYYVRIKDGTGKVLLGGISNKINLKPNEGNIYNIIIPPQGTTREEIEKIQTAKKIEIRYSGGNVESESGEFDLSASVK